MNINEVYNNRVKHYFDLNYSGVLPEDRNAKILDVGFGYGSVLMYLKEQDYANISGIEINRKLVEFVRANITENVELISDIREYFAQHEESYDLIIMKQMIYYIPESDVRGVMRSAYDNLNPGGRILIEANNGALFSSSFVVYKDYSMLTSYTENSLKAVLTETGFRDIRVYGAREKGSGVRYSLWKFAQSCWHCLVRLIYVLERGLDSENPRILSKILIGTGIK